VLIFCTSCVPVAKKVNQTATRWPDLLQAEAYTLADGTSVSIYAYDKTKLYRLADGTVLLTERERDDVCIKNWNASGMLQDDALFLQVDEPVRSMIRTYFDQSDRWYNIADELENAYAICQKRVDDGLSCWMGESDTDGVVVFRAPMISEFIIVESCDENTIRFWTEREKPLPAAQQQEAGYNLGFTEDIYTVFDRRTGEMLYSYPMPTESVEGQAPQVVFHPR